MVVFGATLVGAYAFLGKNLFGAKPSIYYGSFSDAGGITPGTRVLMAGVNVGLVTSVDLVSPTEAKATIAIKPGISIPNGSKLVLPSSLVGLGEQVVQLTPPKEATGMLPAGATLPGGKQKALDSFLPNGEDAVAELTRTMAAFRKLLEDKELTNGLKQVMATSNTTIGEFGKTAGSVNQLITSSQKDLGMLLVSMRKSMENVQGLTKDLYALSKSGKLQGDLTATMTNVRTSSEKVDKLLGEFDKLVSDPELQAALKGSGVNLQKMTDSGVKMAKDGEEISANVAKMSKDGPEISRKISELMDKANEIATKISAITDDVKGSVGKVATALTKSPTSGIGAFSTRYDMIYENDPSFIRTDFTAIFPNANGDSFQLGFWNLFESNSLIAQQSKKVNDNLSLRYGVFASKPGLGVDYSVSPRATLRGDLFSLNDPRFDLRLRYDFSKGVYGWFGVNQMFRDNTPMIGFGIAR